MEGLPGLLVLQLEELPDLRLPGGRELGLLRLDLPFEILVGLVDALLDEKPGRFLDLFLGLFDPLLQLLDLGVGVDVIVASSVFSGSGFAPSSLMTSRPSF